MDTYLMQRFPSKLNPTFHHQSLVQQIYMLDNNHWNFQLNAMLIKHSNQEMNGKYLFHSNLNFYVHSHPVLKSKMKIYIKYSILH